MHAREGGRDMTGPLPAEHVQQLVRLLADDQLILFVGAGISRQAVARDGGKKRLPLWGELANKVAAASGEKLSDYNGNLLDLFDAIAANKTRADLEEAIRKAIPEAAFDPGPTHLKLAQIPWHIVYTTNYDNLLSRVLREPNPIDEEKEYEWLRRAPAQRPKLIHLHGSLSSMGTLTGTDYSTWHDRNPQASTVLRGFALNKSLLFIGYSFNDPHLRELFAWLESVTQGRGKRHYAWMWNLSPQYSRLMDKRDRVEVVNFTRDEQWHKAFEQIIQALPKRRKLAGVATGGARLRTRSSASVAACDTDAVVNGYKLFFHRTQRRMSVKGLSSASGVSATLINQLEQVKTGGRAGPGIFKRAPRDDLARLEKALNCVGALEFGQDDDFLARYLMFFQVNKTVAKGAAGSKSLPFKAPETKCVVFDFGGTLTRPRPGLSTWERLWEVVGADLVEAGDLHRQFLQKKIEHQEWCDITRDRLREKNFRAKHLTKIIEGIEPIAGLEATIQSLHQRGVSLYIVSGSIREIIRAVLGSKVFGLFEEVKANDFRYDRKTGLLSEIRGHRFDFEGKADFIERVIEDKNCAPLEVLFVGNSLNDSWASKSGARTLCVNPQNVNPYDARLWTDCLVQMDDLSQILPFTLPSAAV